MKYLGVDFGLRRVGLAISEGSLASPFKVLEGKKIENLVADIKKEARNFDKIVFGLPEGRLGKLIRRVIKDLRNLGLDVIEVDETLSSQNALKKMIELGISKKKRSVNDAYSAAIILQKYLDNL